MRRAILLSLTLTALSLQPLAPVLAADKGPSPEEIVTKSVEAFAPPDLRSPATGRQLDCKVTWRNIVGGSGNLEGTGFVQTHGDKFHFHLEFNNASYPGEDFVYTGTGQPIIAQIVPAVRSTLGQFLYDNPVAIRSGLLGGVYNSAWPLFNFEKSGAKLTARGTRTVDKKKLNQFEYQGPKQGDTKIFLYFDPETNQHVMTEYRISQAAGSTGSIGAPVGRDTQTILEEHFSEFHQIFGMNIPLVWTIRWNRMDGSVQQWQMTLLKQKLDVPDTAFAPMTFVPTK
jgi:hypothetical protein